MKSARDDDRLWTQIRRVFRLPANRRRIDDEVDEEMQFHLEGRVEELMRREGLSRLDAEREARRRFGDLGYYRREARDIDHSSHRQRTRMDFRDAIGRETRHAARSLARSPSFSIITVITLALAIGAATAIFTLLDAVVLRPLPYANAERLVALTSPVPKIQGQTAVWGLARHEMFYFLERGRTLENMGVYMIDEASVLPSRAAERAERVRSASVSASLFDVLGFVPERGRLFVPDDNHNSTPQVAVLSHGFWERRFGADPGVIGTSISVEGIPVEVVGVLPERAELPNVTTDIWFPAWVDSTTVWNNHTWQAIARLKPGSTAMDAERDLAPWTNRLPEFFPKVYRPTWIENTGFRTAVTPLRDFVVGPTVTRALWTLFGAVALVMLIAAANVANLFLVRFDTRRREVALRSALGAERHHLAWYYATESMLLSVVAGLGAVLVAIGMLRLLLTLAPSELPRLSEVQLSGAGLTFALAVALLAGVTFSVLPMIGRLDFRMLREAGRGLTTSRGRMAARRTLVASQMALAVVLLAGAALMLRTFQNLRAIRPGFDATGVLTLDVALPGAKYSVDGSGGYMEAATRASLLFEQLTARVGALPGVTHVGYTDRMPIISSSGCTAINVIGATPDQSHGSCPPSTLVSPGYFEAMGIRVEGRTPQWAGMNAHDGAAVVSRAFAEHQWPDENPIGKQLSFNSLKPPYYEVVGIAEDVRGQGVDAPAPEYVYFPMLPRGNDARLWSLPLYMHMVVKTTSDRPSSLAAPVTRLAQELEPMATVSNVRTMGAVLASSIAKQSFTMALLLIASMVALLLSAVGIYGVVSYVVATRRSEIGVRMALGAQVAEVTRMVLRQSLVLAAAGIAIGIVGAFAVTRVLSALLYGVAPNDPLTLAVVPLVLLAVALLASMGPARRAARTDPVEALRSD